MTRGFERRRLVATGRDTLREGWNVTPALFKTPEEPVQVCTSGLVVIHRAHQGSHA
jgi:hypothetical protein